MAEGNSHPKIAEAFNAYFKDVQWPTNPALPRGRINGAGWDIRYLLGQQGERTILEIYTMHGFGDDRHLKIADDGALETLPIIGQRVAFDPAVPGDRERAERERKANDTQLLVDLKRKGLW